MNLIIRENFFFFLFFFLPISIIIGPTVSLINIIVLTLFFLIFFVFQKKIDFISHISIKLILILYLYLIFNSFISQNYEIGLLRNLGFIRLIILFIFINYFFFYYNNEKKLFDLWSLIILALLIDVFVEYFFGTNLLGWGAPDQPYGYRITSFFKNEPIVGAYLAGFVFLIFGHFLTDNKKAFAFLFLLVVFLAIIFTGERSNTIKVFLGIIIYFFFIDFFKIKTKLIIILIFFTTFGVLLSQSQYLKLRYISQFYNVLTNKKNFQNLEKNQYIRLYKSGYSVFKNYPLFGVGNKNYRVEVCKKKNNSQLKSDYVCLTHPHQVYFELLSEHGIIGFILILSIFFFLMFKILKSILMSRNYIQIGAFTFVVINFIPFLPGGSFFSDFNITLFWINFSIMFACSKKTNIFAKNHI
tara:strand:+ start:581 stop:1819 length:1239 start_codon:yes stop_codon:yes gene_type:complete